MALTETKWVTPNAVSLNTIMAQVVLNAAEIPLAQSTGGNTANQRSKDAMRMTVASILAAIVVGGKVPVSQNAATVPPEAEMHVYVLTVNSMTASTPNLNNVVVGLNGQVFSPWNDMVKRAYAWIDAVRKGLVVQMPSWPAVTGDGNELTPAGSTYATNNTIAVTGLQVGLQYAWVAGPNEVSFVNGTTTLTGSGAFYATSTTATITGTAGAVLTGSLQVAQLAANLATSGQIFGQYDMSTDGPYFAGQQPSQTIGTL